MNGELEAAHKAANWRDALEAAKYCLVNRHTCSGYTIEDTIAKIDAALAAPARKCDKVKDHSDAIGKFEKWMDFSPKTADEQDAFFKEHWFEFAVWLIDMNESDVKDGSK